MPDRRQDRELVLGSVVVADIGFQQDICRGLVGPLDGSGVPLAAGDLIGIGIIRQGCAGHHGQPHSRRRDRRSGGDSGHRHELDVGPGRVAGPAADVQPQADTPRPLFSPIPRRDSPAGDRLSFLVGQQYMIVSIQLNQAIG